MRFVVFQHLACEHPGIWRQFMRDDGVDVVTVELDAGDVIPPLGSADGLLVFGGPMNVDEDERYPWLRPETEVIHEAAQRGMPILGVCLGAQLLAKALGAKVRRNPVPEVGLLEVTLTEAGEADPLLADWPRRAAVVQWHSDTFAIPSGATLLATSPGCRNQAFRYGAHAYGLQFHPEVTADMVAEWREVPEYAEVLRRMNSGAEGGGFDGVARHGPELARRARLLYDNFRALVARRISG